MKIVNEHIENVFDLVYLLARVLRIVSTHMEHPENLLESISGKRLAKKWDVSCPGRAPVRLKGR